MVNESTIDCPESFVQDSSLVDEERVQELIGRLTLNGRVYAAICEEPEDVLILQASYEGRSYADMITHKITERLWENLGNRKPSSSEPRPKSGKGL